MRSRARLALGGRRLGRRIGASGQVAVEARALAGMAGGPGRLDQSDEGVTVAVEAELPDALDVPGCLTLVPDLVAGSG